MHALTMNHMLDHLQSKKDKPFRMLDVGCGHGYSTLVYSRLASLIRDTQFLAVGTDFHQSFIEKAVLNSQKYSAPNQ